MSYQHATYTTDGSCALAPERNFVVLEGGLSAAAKTCTVERAEKDVLHKGVLSFRDKVRIALFFAASLVFLTGVLVYSDASASAAREAAFASIETEVVRVHEGDTLWTIAESRAQEGCSTSDLVEWIEDANDLDGALLVSGQELIVPSANQ